MGLFETITALAAAAVIALAVAVLFTFPSWIAGFVGAAARTADDPGHVVLTRTRARRVTVWLGGAWAAAGIITVAASNDSVAGLLFAAPFCALSLLGAYAMGHASGARRRARRSRRFADHEQTVLATAATDRTRRIAEDAHERSADRYY